MLVYVTYLTGLLFYVILTIYILLLIYWASWQMSANKLRATISLVKGRHTWFSLKLPLTLCAIFFLFLKLGVYSQVPEELKYKGISVYFIKGTFSIISLKIIHPSDSIPTMKDREVSLTCSRPHECFQGKKKKSKIKRRHKDICK